MYREFLCAAEGTKEDKASWTEFFKWLKSRDIAGVRLVIGDKCLGMLEAVGEEFQEAKYNDVNMSAAFYTRRRQCFTVAAEKFDTCGGGI